MRFSRQHPLEKAKHSADILQNQMGDTGQTDGTYQQHQHREGNPVLPAAGDKRHQRQDAKGQGEGAVDAAIKLANGEKVEKIIDVPYQLITKDNMAEFVNRNQK